MPRRPTSSDESAHYHVYNRGVGRAPIFFEEENYAFFMRRLRSYATEASAEIVASCLMPNHFHLLVHTETSALSPLMHRLGMSYANAINKRYNRVGPLFQGRFQSKVIVKDDYLLHLSRYIHLNPVAAGLVVRAEDWPYSSYLEYIGLRDGALPSLGIVLGQVLPLGESLHEVHRAYRDFVESDEDHSAVGEMLLLDEEA